MGPKLIVSVIFIAIGAVASVPFKDPSVTVLGVVLVCIATLASSLKPVVGQLLMTASQKPKLAPAALVFYDSCFSFVFMIIYWLSVPAEREGSFAYMGAKPAMGWSIILIGSFAAFMYNMSIFYFTKLASAVAVMVSTNLLKVALITAAAVLEGIRDPINWIGITVFFGCRRVRLLEPRGQAGGEEGRGGDGAERGRQAYRNEQIGALDPLQARNEQWCIKIDER